jgi:hypothetical protein
VRKILIRSALVLAVTLPATLARADDACDRFGRESAMFQDEHSDAVRELDRVNASNPVPTKDVALCRAVRGILIDGVYFHDADTSHPSCFSNVEEAKDFTVVVHKWIDGAATLAGVYCSDEELRRPIKSKVNECIPNC